MHVNVLIGKTLVGVLAEIDGNTYFEYDDGFLRTGRELSPLHLPLQPGAKPCQKAFLQNLPGMCSDTLPDAWGKRVMERWFETEKHRGIESVTPLEQLCFIGNRGVGALEYEPGMIADDPIQPGVLDMLDLRRLETEARAVLDAAPEAAIPGLIELARNGSAGGARPKLWIGVKEDGDGPGRPRLIGGATDIPPDYTPWLLKFDLPIPQTPYREYGKIEHAYALMADEAGLRVCKTRLFAAKGEDGAERAHFAIARFDRTISGERIHFHSLAGITESDFNGQIDYRELLSTTQQVTRDQGEVLEAFRRAAFNVAARIRDDHGKNHGFLYHGGQWRLSPAYDLVYASPGAFRRHAMPIAGNAFDPGLPDLLRLAEEAELTSRQAREVVEKCRGAVSKWHRFAEKAGISPTRAAEIERELPGRSWGPVPVARSPAKKAPTIPTG